MFLKFFLFLQLLFVKVHFHERLVQFGSINTRKLLEVCPMLLQVLLNFAEGLVVLGAGRNKIR